MTPERWAQVKDVLHRAIQLAPETRAAFLDGACARDDSLRQEVETLLAADVQARSSFLQSPPVVGLAKGSRLGDYEIQSLIGAGGMGEVYRARDIRLRRDVAVKVLPALFSSDPERLRRFEQEAMAAAALSHPNILAVFQMGTYGGAPYLVCELLEGETLQEQIKRGRMAWRRAIDYAVQAARGLAAAHEKGIVHRDLKPENLFVTKDGRVKILDFGLAKLMQPQPSSDQSAPTADGVTKPGAVMGTVGYMSPEQVRGQKADHRADIFAFGAILYEMLTGQRAFQKPTAAETLTAILNEDPPAVSQITPNISAALQRVAHRCLEKNREQRFQSASDLAFALEALSDSDAALGTKVERETSQRVSRSKTRVLVVLLGATILAAGLFYRFGRSKKLTDKDTVVLADFANSTGDPVFDGTLRQGLAAELEQSPFLNLLSDQRISQTLRLMTRPKDTRLTRELAREVCVRTGSAATIEGSIASLGTQYVLGLEAVNCRTGDSLAEEQVTADGKEQVLKALGGAATGLRKRLGESLASIEKYDTPTEEVTTPSLEALRDHSIGVQAETYKNDFLAAIPFYERATRLDPNFALAYFELGLAYENVGQISLGSENLRRAFELRERAGEEEKLRIENWYFTLVLGDLEEARKSAEIRRQLYPHRSLVHHSLGFIYRSLGELEKALGEALESVRVEPSYPIYWATLVSDYIVLNHFDEAQRAANEAQAKRLDSADLRHSLYLLAFLRNDSGRMIREVTWATGRSGAEDIVAADANTAACFGKLGKARSLARQAIDAARRAGNEELAAQYQAASALREALLGNATDARRQISVVTKHPSERYTEYHAALALAYAGDERGAHTMIDDLAKRFPQDTLVQSVYLPTLRAKLALNREPSRAIEGLQSATAYEYGRGCVFSIYVRGEAYLAAHRGGDAAAEFQKVLDHRGLVANNPVGALARFNLGRAYALEAGIPESATVQPARGKQQTAGKMPAPSGDALAKARTAYEDFLALWKDADPDIPILKQAKTEYARLH